MKPLAVLATAAGLALGGVVHAHEPTAHAVAASKPGALSVQPIAEKTVATLPPGDLYWHVETFDTLAAAQAAAGPWSLAAEADGRAWLLTLGPAGTTTSGGRTVREIGPIRHPTAARYLLRVNYASGPAGSITAAHSHPGSETFFVLQGEQRLHTASGVVKIPSGTAHAGDDADMAMRVSSGGPEPLRALVLFVVDADRPFSTPATLP